MFKVILFFSTFFHISRGMTITSIFINQWINPPLEAVISCTVTGSDASAYKVYLHCPLVANRVCFTNCTPSCDFIKGRCEVLKPLASIRCEYHKFDSDHVELKYFVNAGENINKDGKWQCTYKGINSKPVKLEMPKVSYTTTTKRSFRNPNVKRIDDGTNTLPDGSNGEVPIIRIPEKKRENSEPKINPPPERSPPPETTKEMNFQAFITRLEVVIVIICLFFASILVNFIFCIRESMIKFYIENLKSNIHSHKLLLLCICQRDPVEVSATAKLDRILSKETDNSYNKFSNKSHSDIYTSEAFQPLIPSTLHHSHTELGIKTAVGRSSSFQQAGASPMLMQKFSEPYYMTTPRLYAPVYMDSNGTLWSVKDRTEVNEVRPSSDFDFNSKCVDDASSFSNKLESVSMSQVPSNVQPTNEKNVNLVKDGNTSETSPM